MAVVVEVLDRHKRVAHRYFFHHDQISIGRAYDNDVILDDYHVDAYHAELFVGDDEFSLNDLSSLNGIRDKRKKRLTSVVHFRDSQDFVVGDTRIRITDPSQPVAAALDLKQDGLRAKVVNSMFTALVLLSFVVLKALTNTYVSSTEDIAGEVYVQSLATQVALVFGSALFFSFIAKVIRREWRFVFHLVFFSALYLFVSAGDFILQIVAFNWSLVKVQWLIDAVWLVVLVVILLLGLMRSAFLVKPKFQKVAILAVAGILFSFMTASELLSSKPKYIRLPPMTRVFMSEALILRAPVSDQAFLEASDKVFDIELKD